MTRLKLDTPSSNVHEQKKHMIHVNMHPSNMDQLYLMAKWKDSSASSYFLLSMYTSASLVCSVSRVWCGTAFNNLLQFVRPSMNQNLNSDTEELRGYGSLCDTSSTTSISRMTVKGDSKHTNHCEQEDVQT